MTLEQVYSLSLSKDFQVYKDYVDLLQQLDEKELAYKSLSIQKDNILDIVNLHDVVLPNLESLVEDAEISLKNTVSIYEDIVSQIEKYKKLQIFYQAALDRLSDDYLVNISNLLTDVYQGVFNDYSTKVKIHMVDYRGRRSVRLKLLVTSNGQDYSEEFSDQGGSAQVIIGLLMSIFVIMSMKLPRILFIDETLSSLHTDVLHRFLSTLKTFRDKHNFSFLIIDHAVDRFRDFIDNVYTINNGVVAKIELDSI